MSMVDSGADDWIPSVAATRPPPQAAPARAPDNLPDDWIAPAAPPPRQAAPAPAAGADDWITPPTPPPAPQPAPPAPQRVGLFEAAEHGAQHAIRSLTQLPGAVSRTANVDQPEPEYPEAQPVEWGDVLSPVSKLAPKIVYGAAASAPTLAGAAGGAAVLGTAGTAIAGPPGGAAGAVAGSAIGATAMSAAQAIGPYYQAALREGAPPDQAYDHALKSATADGVISGVAFAAFGWAPFGGFVKNILFQSFGPQPTIAAGGRAVKNYLDDKPIEEGVAGEVPGAIANSLIPAAAIHGTRSLLRGGEPARAPGQSTPGDINDFVGRAQGMQTRAEIDEFLRQRAAREAAAGVGNPQLPPPGPSAPAESPGVPPSAPSAPGGATAMVEREGLIRYGYTPAQVDAMPPEMRRAEYLEAVASGAAPSRGALDGEIIPPGRKGEFEQVPWTADDGNPWGMSDEDYRQWRLRPENREAVAGWNRANNIIDPEFEALGPAPANAVGMRQDPRLDPLRAAGAMGLLDSIGDQARMGRTDAEIAAWAGRLTPEAVRAARDYLGIPPVSPPVVTSAPGVVTSDAPITQQNQQAAPGVVTSGQNLVTPTPQENPNDRQVGQGLPGQVGGGQEPVQAGNVQGAGGEAARTGGVVQAPQAGEVANPPREGLGSHVLKAMLDDPRSAAELRGEIEAARNWQPTDDWQDVPPGAPLAPGLDVRSTPEGVQQARLAPPEGTREAPVRLETPADVHAGAELTAQPTPAQAEAGNYTKRHVKWQGRDISVETEQGAVRTAADGSWSVVMPAPYGHILGTKGADGDPVDVYLGPNPQSPRTFVIDQIDPETGKWDEHKVMVGFLAERSAASTYMDAFSDGSGPSRLGAITEMPVAQLKAWLASGDTKKPVAYQDPAVSVRAAAKAEGLIANEEETKAAASAVADGADPVHALVDALEQSALADHAELVDAQQNEVVHAAAAANETGARSPKAGQHPARVEPQAAPERAPARVEPGEDELHGGTPAQWQRRLDELLAKPAVRKSLRGRVAVNRDYDIPYFAGYSKDGRTVYVDRGFTGDVPESLIRHERVEKALIDAIGFTYQQAHEFATFAEHRMVQDAKAYEATLRPHIDAARAKAPEKVPADLDLTPYKGETALLEKMTSARERRGAGAEATYNYDQHLTNPGERDANRAAVDALNGKITPDDALAQIGELVRSGKVSEGYARVQFNRLDVTEGDVRKALEAKAEPGAEGKPQLVLPGAEKIGQGEQAQRKADQPLKPTVAQKPADVGLFGDESKQTDLLDLARKPPPKPASNESAKRDEAPAAGPSDSGRPVASRAGKPASPSIEDFGEKIGGARKETFAGFRDSLKEEMDVATEPLSKSFPQPNYEKLVAAGVNKRSLAYIAIMRDMIPPKPRQAWKVRQWVTQVAALRNFARQLLDGDIDVATLNKAARDNHLLRDLPLTAEAIEDVAPDDLPKAAEYRMSSGSYSVLYGQRYSPSKTFWHLEGPKRRMVKNPFSNDPAMDYSHRESPEEAVALAKKIIAHQLEKSEAERPTDNSKYTEVGVYRDRVKNEVFLGFKVRSTVLRLKAGFADVKSAREYLQENRDSLQATIDEMRHGPNMRGTENRPRSGAALRDGDVSPETFSDSFGFRGVQFGNYVEGRRRQEDLNRAFDALMDLADTLSIPPQALSLNGSLGLAFGARGHGGRDAAAAHYELGQVVINLTKGGGPGSLAHEWLHALDNYFARQDAASGYISERKRDTGPVRDQVYQAWKAVEASLSKGTFADRSAEFDKARSKPYWGTTIEKAARAFERHVVDRMSDKGAVNDYLANIDTAGGAYPTDKEMQALGIRAAFDQLFNAIETKPGERPGTVALYSIRRGGATVDANVIAEELKGLRSDRAGFDARIATLAGEVNGDTLRSAVESFLGHKSVEKSKTGLIEQLKRSQRQWELNEDRRRAQDKIRPSISRADISAARQAVTDVVKSERVRGYLKDALVLAVDSLLAHGTQMHGSMLDQHIHQAVDTTVRQFRDVADVSAAKVRALLKEVVARLRRDAEPSTEPPTPLEGPERIVGAAVLSSDGRVFIGGNHVLATDEARQAGADYMHIFDGREGREVDAGFFTSRGRYVSRHEAADIANAAGKFETEAIYRMLKRDGVLAEAILPRKTTKQADADFIREWQGRKITKQLTSAAQQRRADLERALTQLVRAMVGKNVRVQFPDTIPLPNKAAGWGSHADDVQTAAGVYVPLDALIKLAMNDPSYSGNPQSTAFHESFHAIEHQLLTKSEMDLLVRETDRLRKFLNDRVEGPTAQSKDWADELAGYEVRAIAFEMYANQRAKKKPLDGFHTGIARLFNKLLLFLQRLRNALRNLGFKTTEDIFSEVYEGRMAGREPVRGPRAEKPQFSQRPLSEIGVEDFRRRLAEGDAPAPARAPTAEPTEETAPVARTPEELAQRIAEMKPRSNQWISVPEGGIYVRIGERPDIGTTLEIPNIEFREEARGSGAFTKYLSAMERAAADRNLDAVYVEQIFNKRLEQFLRRHGYRDEPRFGGMISFSGPSDQATLYKRVDEAKLFVPEEPYRLSTGNAPHGEAEENAADALESAGNRHIKAMREIDEHLAFLRRMGGENEKVRKWEAAAAVLKRWKKDGVELVGAHKTESERDYDAAQRKSDEPHYSIRRSPSRGAEQQTSKLRAFADRAVDLVDEARMKVAPMATGSTVSMSAAKDYANAVRLARHEWSRRDDLIKKNYTPEERRQMWEAADQESVAEQLGVPLPPDQGLASLEPHQRTLVEGLQDEANAAWMQAQSVGIVRPEAEGLPSYVPRMVVMMNEEGHFERPPSREKVATSDGTGRNFRTSTSQVKHRKHMTAAETEAAMKARFGETAQIAKDIRALSLATAKLREAIAARTLINRIKAVGNMTGEATVSEGEEPQDGHRWFTLDHPAFKVYRPLLRKNDETGQWEIPKYEDGSLAMERVPIYVRSDFKGPLLAVMGKDNGAIYNGLMALKGKTMSLVMYSPAIHNVVEWSRALPAYPLKVASTMIYFEGNRAKNDPAQMREAISAGMVPIGKRFFNQDITSIMEEPNLAPGRSWTAQVLGFVPGLFDANAGDAVKRTVDAAGDLWHNKLLWDRIADLQMGLYVNMRRDLVAKGHDGQTASRVSAHFANRYAGALPIEAMSTGARKLANLLLFSRTFTFGNLGAMKDALTGLPRDVQAQIERDAGSEALRRIKNFAKRKSVAIILLDIALGIITTSILQDALKKLRGEEDWPELFADYYKRFTSLIEKTKNDPLGTALHPINAMWKLSSTASNEPRKREGTEARILLYHDKNGRAVYGRNPIGKIGEEFTGWPTAPGDMILRKLGTFARPALQTMLNDKYAGAGFEKPTRIWRPSPEGVEWFKNIGRIAEHFAEAQLPIDALRSASDLMDDDSKKDPLTSKLKILAPLAGVSISQGHPGGMRGAILEQRRQERGMDKRFGQ